MLWLAAFERGQILSVTKWSEESLELIEQINPNYRICMYEFPSPCAGRPKFVKRTSQAREKDIPNSWKGRPQLVRLRLQSQCGEIAISINRDCNLVSTSMGAPFSETPSSDDAVLMNVRSACNKPVNQEKGKSRNWKVKNVRVRCAEMFFWYKNTFLDISNFKKDYICKLNLLYTHNSLIMQYKEFIRKGDEE